MLFCSNCFASRVSQVQESPSNILQTTQQVALKCTTIEYGNGDIGATKRDVNHQRPFDFYLKLF